MQLSFDEPLARSRLTRTLCTRSPTTIWLSCSWLEIEWMSEFEETMQIIYAVLGRENFFFGMNSYKLIVLQWKTDASKRVTLLLPRKQTIMEHKVPYHHMRKNSLQQRNTFNIKENQEHANCWFTKGKSIGCSLLRPKFASPLTYEKKAWKRIGKYLLAKVLLRYCSKGGVNKTLKKWNLEDFPNSRWN